MTSIDKKGSKESRDEKNKGITEERRNNENFGKQLLETGQLIVDVILLYLKILWYIGEAFYRRIIPVPEKCVAGEIVLITGTGHGIGKELALQYASQGATVVCWDINKKENEETVKEIAESKYPKAYAYVCNVANRNNVMETAKKVQKEVGEVTILINNAGIMPCHPFLEQTVDDIERTMNVNVMAHFWTLQAFLPAMINHNRGHIVAVASGCGLVGLRNLVPYCTSKFAVRGMMEVLHQELYANPNCNIKLTCIYPWMVNTGLCKKPKLRFPNMMRLLEPQDVAKAILSAQRRDVVETSIPSSQYNAHCYMKLFPAKANWALQDFLDFYVESDL